MNMSKSLSSKLTTDMEILKEGLGEKLGLLVFSLSSFAFSLLHIIKVKGVPPLLIIIPLLLLIIATFSVLQVNNNSNLDISFFKEKILI